MTTDERALTVQQKVERYAEYLEGCASWAATVTKTGDSNPDAVQLREAAALLRSLSSGSVAGLLRELDALYEKAKGPWLVSYTDCYEIVGKRFRVAVLYATDEAKENAECIVALVNAWPQLRALLSAPEPSALEIAERVREACVKVCAAKSLEWHDSDTPRANAAWVCKDAIYKIDLPAVLSGMKEGK